jgi:hypothetical protein
MFDTVLGSVILLTAMLGIIFVLALFLTGILRWIFLTDQEWAETTTVRQPSTVSQLRKAA